MKYFLVCGLFLFSVAVLADAPVFNAATDDTMQQRLQHLEAQVQSQIQLNVPGQISELREQVAHLNGELELQTHQLQQLASQLHAFYQDLNQRVEKASAKQKVKAGTAQTVLSKNSTAERKNYSVAFNLLINKKYSEATTAFAHYLKQYPQGQYAVNAHYWLGQMYFIQRRYADAKSEFNIVVKRFPDSSKVPDAKLKLAYIQAHSGDEKAAVKALKALIKEYPNTSVARLAKLKLVQLKE